MAGRLISISFSPFHGDMFDLWSRVTTLLLSDFALDLSDSEVAELIYDEDGDWALGVGFEDLDLSTEDFLRLSQGAVIRADLQSLGLQLHTEVSFFRDPPTVTGTPSLCVSFGTILHRQLYLDVTQLRAEDHPKRALLRLCFALAEALKTSAFIIEDNDNRLFRPLDPEEFVRLLLTRPTHRRGHRHGEPVGSSGGTYWLLPGNQQSPHLPRRADGRLAKVRRDDPRDARWLRHHRPALTAAQENTAANCLF